MVIENVFKKTVGISVQYSFVKKLKHEFLHSILVVLKLTKDNNQ